MFFPVKQYDNLCRTCVHYVLYFLLVISAFVQKQTIQCPFEDICIIFVSSKMESQSQSLLQPVHCLQQQLTPRWPKRSSNFSRAEESLLVSLAKEYMNIIENKKSDTNTNREKIQCWQKIEREFNAQNGGVNRSAQVLRKKYENIKKTTKKKVAEEKCQRFRTGGGPNTDFKFTDVDETIMEVLGDTRVQGFPSVFGGDTDFDNTESIEIVVQDTDTFEYTANSTCFTDEQAEKPDFSLASTQENDDFLKSWKKCSGEMLKTPKSKALRNEKGNNSPTMAGSKQQQREVTNKVSKWAEKKTEVEARKKEYYEEEHRMKMALLQEKHNLEMEILKKESNVKILKIEKEMDQIVKGMQGEQQLRQELLKLEKAVLLKKSKKNCNVE